jgi:hypothetical protein
MSTARVYEHRGGRATRPGSSQAGVEVDARSVQALLRRTAAVLDGSRFKKALFVATVAAAALYYATLILIIVVF